MSVREKPVANRYLDLLEKERSYRRHVHKVARTKATINTTQPETPRRLMVAERNNTRYRNGMRRTFVEHDRLVSDVARPRTATVGPRAGRSTNTFSQRSSFRDESDIFSSDIMTPQPQKYLPTADHMEEPRYPQTPQGRTRRVEAVRIGFGPKPVIEAEDIEDESNGEVNEFDGKALDVAVPCDDDKYEEEPGMFVT